MNNIDKQYQLLLQDIIDNGVEKKDRTGTGTLSVFGRQIRHKMNEGFPLLTTKKMAWKSVVTELLWFMKGDTNIKFLLDNDCHIWNGDAYKRYVTHWDNPIDPVNFELYTRLDLHPDKRLFTKEEFIERIKTDDEFAKTWGELGPIYGKQWRDWNGKWKLTEEDSSNFEKWRQNLDRKGIDQIANLINELKINPDSRRLMVNAWNVGELDQMVLPPCHYGFQVYTRELSTVERMEYYGKHYMKEDEAKSFDDLLKVDYDGLNIPTRAISLMWNQRSVDTFLGLPFNIASYGLLLEIIAKTVNMAPDELIGNLGDVHLYSNHVEQAKEQIGRELTLEERIDLASSDIHFDPLEFGVGNLVTDRHIHNVCDKYGVPRRTREPYELPKLGMDYREGEYDKNLKDFVPDDFYLINYQSHPAIKAPLSN